jgi:peptidoglycan-N-acetylglucosamine deacetylase
MVSTISSAGTSPPPPAGQGRSPGRGAGPAKSLPWAKRLAKRLISESALVLGTTVGVWTRERAVALTFDDGPHPDDTPPVLDLLARHGGRATFFVVGQRARAHPELIERMAREGHAIGNHSWDHTSFRLLNGRARRAQMQWTEAAIAPHGRRLFRPPYAEQSLASRLDALALGQRVTMGEVVAEDWRDDRSEVLVERVMRRLLPGSILLFHDTLITATEERYRDRTPTRQAVDALLQRLAGEYRFVTVPELLRLGRARRAHHYWKLPAQFHRELR